MCKGQDRGEARAGGSWDGGGVVNANVGSVCAWWWRGKVAGEGGDNGTLKCIVYSPFFFFACSKRSAILLGSYSRRLSTYSPAISLLRELTLNCGLFGKAPCHLSIPVFHSMELPKAVSSQYVCHSAPAYSYLTGDETSSHTKDLSQCLTVCVIKRSKKIHYS